MALFFEGVDAVAQPCTLVIVLPAMALVLLARASRATLATGYLLATSLLMWAKAAGHWTVAPRGGVVVVLAAAIGATFVAAGHRRRDSLAFAAAGAVGGALAGWLWQPCVGTEFGEVLNRAASDEAATLALMTVYVAGALLPAFMLAAAPAAIPRLRPALDHAVVRGAALGFGALYALMVATGNYDDLVGELVRRSSA